VTLLVYLQFDRTATLREEMVALSFWKRTFTVPEQITLGVGSSQ
jgi:hypothetical protein